MDTRDVIAERKKYSDERLAALKQEVHEKAELRNAEELCIYVTGSFGRGEASEFSDLDLFFVHSGAAAKHPVTKIDKAILDASLIKIAEAMKFPPFSKGGEYLTVHHAQDILGALGSPEDDYRNYFTARLLLLLESKCVHNQPIYDQIKAQIIESYYRDYHDHERDFQPVFLVNDILRFWRTLCLNYEHNRERPARSKQEDPAADMQRRKSYVKNLKLKYSRLLTCYSAIAAILSIRGAVSHANILGITSLTPLERLDYVLQNSSAAAIHIEQVRNEYAKFLETTAQSEADLLAWIGEKSNRETAFSNARTFSKGVYALLNAACDDSDKLRYLVI